MGKNVFEMMAEEGSDKKRADFLVKQKQDYKFKKSYAASRVREFIQECEKRDLNYHVSVGGLDSITLWLFIHSLGYHDVPAVTVSYIENPGNQRVHKALGMIRLTAEENRDGKKYNMMNVIPEFGFPVLSKEIAGKIELLQRPTEDNKTVRHAIITGETGEYGGWQKNSRMRLSQKWLDKFGGLDAEGAALGYGKPNFECSAKCCYYLKEKPSDRWAKQNNSVPFMGLMASEGGRRAKSLMLHGCNYFGKSTIRSCPFAIFYRDDLLRLALEMDEYYKTKLKDEFEKRLKEEGKLPKNFVMPESIIPEEYGTIEKYMKIENVEHCSVDGKFSCTVKELVTHLRTTGEQRTGCRICGFGIHLEKRPHRFDRVYYNSPKLWEHLMFHLCVDDNGEEYGWARVLEYIGVGWRIEDLEEKSEQIPGQMTIFDLEDM